MYTHTHTHILVLVLDKENDPCSSIKCKAVMQELISCYAVWFSETSTKVCISFWAHLSGKLWRDSAHAT